MNETQISFESLYRHLESVREEVVSELGKGISFHIVAFHGNTWIDINSWLLVEYRKEAQSNIVILEFQRLFKEIYWFQYVFLNCNYPLIYRNLRFVWELIYRAQYVLLHHNSSSLDDQLEHLASLEKRKYGWKIIEEVLRHLLLIDERQINNEIHPLWDDLNSHVHPSTSQMIRFLEKDPRSLVTDSFNRELALSTISVTDKVFDLIFASIFKQFRAISRHTSQYRKLDGWKHRLPYTFRVCR